MRFFLVEHRGFDSQALDAPLVAGGSDTPTGVSFTTASIRIPSSILYLYPPKEREPAKRTPFPLVEHRGFEPLTPTLPVLCAPNCANAPSELYYSTIFGIWQGVLQIFCFGTKQTITDTKGLSQMRFCIGTAPYTVAGSADFRREVPFSPLVSDFRNRAQRGGGGEKGSNRENRTLVRTKDLLFHVGTSCRQPIRSSAFQASFRCDTPDHRCEASEGRGR